MRQGEVKRQTKETNIELALGLDGSGKASVETGVGFFDHLLNSFIKHGFFNLILQAEGDNIVDCHHTVEDVGICLGQAFAIAVGNAEGVKRFGNSFVPMDEALAQVTVDISGRPYLIFRAGFEAGSVGEFPTELIEEFFRAFVNHAKVTLHINLIYGKNSHHSAEAIFKAFGQALGEAVVIDPRLEGVLSTKGVL